MPADGSLKVINGFWRNFEQYHGVANGTPEADELESKYLKMLRRARQNMMYVGGVRGITRPDENDVGEYTFDFSPLEAIVKRYKRMA